jgi:lipopolysaccharide transport system ATP-binding protein
MSSPVTSNSQPVTSSTADQEVLVKVEGVSKKFCRSLKKSLWYGVCDIGAELNPFRRGVAGLSVSGERLLDETDSEPQITSNTPGHPPGGITNNSSALRPGEFWAVDDVSFELRRGECLGLIGHNGAGKTTLLKMLNGLIKPDSGKITMRGRVGALIALGAGFNPILTGRENIYINGSVLGLSKKEPERSGDRLPQAGPQGFAFQAKREPNRREDRRDHRLCRDRGIHRLTGAELQVDSMHRRG